MAVSPADIKALPSGEFAAVADPTVQLYLDEAAREVSESLFGARYDDAIRNLAAHLLATDMGGSKGPQGAVVGHTVGPVSTQYAQPSALQQPDALHATTYGRRYAALRRQVAGGPQVL